MTARSARVNTGAYFTDIQGNQINLGSLITLPFSEIVNSDLVLAPGSNFISVPLPMGSSLAAFVWVFATQIADLKAAIAFDQQAACPVPQGCGMVFYNAPAFYVSSVAGGTLHVAMGA